MAVTGERISTPADGFNPTWQRHVAAYALCAELLPAGRTLDLGCGTGHSYELLAPRETVGVDIDAEALAEQDRETRVADMRDLPFPDRSFAGLISVQSIEHVPDPERVVAEAARVLEPDGVAVFVTPNRLTLPRPDEVVNPYHFVEFAPDELESVCSPRFEEVRVRGLFGSERYLEWDARRRQRVERVLRMDPLRLRRVIPRGMRQRLNDWKLARDRSGPDPRAASITVDDFELRESDVGGAIDVVGVCRRPRR